MPVEHRCPTRHTDGVRDRWANRRVAAQIMSEAGGRSRYQRILRIRLEDPTVPSKHTHLSWSRQHPRNRCGFGENESDFGGHFHNLPSSVRTMGHVIIRCTEQISSL